MLDWGDGHFVNRNVAAIPNASMQREERGLGAFNGRHCNDGERTRPPDCALNGQLDITYAAFLSKQKAEILLGRPGRQIADK